MLCFADDLIKVFASGMLLFVDVIARGTDEKLRRPTDPSVVDVLCAFAIGIYARKGYHFLVVLIVMICHGGLSFDCAQYKKIIQKKSAMYIHGARCF